MQDAHRDFHYSNSFSVENDEFTREQYLALEKEAWRLQRADAPGSLEPFEQTLMRIILELRKGDTSCA